jgi:Domain of unknown function (DUF4402)
MTQTLIARFSCAFLAFGSFVGASMIATPTLAQSSGWSASATVNVYAEVIQPLQIEAIAPLSFGGLRGGIDAGSITIAPDGARTMSGGAMSIEDALAQDGPQAMAGPPPSAARYGVTGEAGRSYGITTPTRVSVTGRPLNADDIAMTLVAHDFTIITASMPNAGPFGQLDVNGYDQFSLGATIDVPANAAAAYYVVTVPVMVEYT